MKLSELKTGQTGTIAHISGKGMFRHRITEMGFVKGKRVRVVKNAPLYDPIEYCIMGYEVSLRRSEAAMIDIDVDEPDMDFECTADMPAVDPQEQIPAKVDIKHDRHLPAHNPDNNIIKVALVGNPNSGKTSLFNYISGLNEHTGNYSGVTVDSKSASVDFNGYVIQVTDLPGTYSISDFSPEERFVREFISREKPDIIVNVVDGSNLERNLYLTTQLIDMESRVVIALNMYDELLQSGDRFNRKGMEQLLGMPIIPTVSKRGRGIPQLLRQIVDSHASFDPQTECKRIVYQPEIEELIERTEKIIKSDNRTSFTNRYVAIKLVGGDAYIRGLYADDAQIAQLTEECEKHIKSIYNDTSGTLVAEARYGFISGAMKETYVASKKRIQQDRATRIDRLLTNKYLGLPIFALLLWIIFYATFTLGAYPMEWIEAAVGLLQDWIKGIMPDGALKSLIANGIIGGVGSVIVFLPNILILFLFISLMEDTGYMARAAFITDKLMHKIGLHGKSFIPLIMGFGCGVPAIMSTRTIENYPNRLQTMLLVPFMSCSARLPVYLLIVGAFFPNNAANMLFIIYFFGIIIAILSSLLFKKLFFNKKEVHFVMELPPYRIPTVRSTMKHMWNKGSQYLRKMGGIILVAVIIIWALGYYPNGDRIAGNHEPTQQEQDSIMNTSYLGQIGHAIEPGLRPLGYDWKMGIGLLSGIAAKEVVVSSMSVIYQAGEGEDDEQTYQQLGERIKQEYYVDGPGASEPVWNTAVALSFLTFVLIYFPCLAVVMAIRKESGRWKWALFTVLYTTGLAWVVSFIVYRVALLFT